MEDKLNRINSELIKYKNMNYYEKIMNAFKNIYHINALTIGKVEKDIKLVYSSDEEMINNIHSIINFKNNEQQVIKWNIVYYNNYYLYLLINHEDCSYFILMSKQDKFCIDTKDSDVFMFILNTIINLIDNSVKLQIIENNDKNLKNNLEKEKELQEYLYEINNLSNKIVSKEDFYHYIFSRIHKFIKFSDKNHFVSLYDKNKKYISFDYSKNEFGIVLKDRFFNPNGISESVILNQKFVIINNKSLLDYGHEDLKKTCENGKKANFLIVPLYGIEDNSIIGVIGIYNYDNNIYTSEDLELLSYIANNVSVSLNHQLSKNKLEEVNKKLEKMLKSRTEKLSLLNKKLSHKETHDVLTDLPNRNYFNEELMKRFQEFNEHDNYFGLFLINLDRFKLVNESLGHINGDKVLKEAALKINKCLRREDFLSRLNGDEFTILVNFYQKEKIEEQIAIISKRLLDEFEEPFILDGQKITITISIGVCLVNHSVKIMVHNDILKNANEALKEAKGKGRNGYVLFEDKDKKNNSDALLIESELRKALLENNEIVPYYQPIFDLQNNRLIGFESLVRWNHKELGLLQPSVFLPIAEETSLITKLDLYLLNSICKQLLSWKEKNINLNNLTIHINMSGINFKRKDFLSSVIEIIRSYDIPLNIINIELTENIFVVDSKTVSETMIQFSHHGIMLSLDDFGTGYSSLSYLNQYHFDLLKIDKSFINNIESDTHNQAIAKSIIALATALNLGVVAEGVETKEQLEYLKSLGCNYIQGYYIGKPMPVDSFDIIDLEKKIIDLAN